MKTIEQVKRENKNRASLIDAVIERLGGMDDELMGTIEDIAGHGADAGWCGFTYTKDTCEFYQANRKEINDWIKNTAEETRHAAQKTSSAETESHCLNSALRGPNDGVHLSWPTWPFCNYSSLRTTSCIGLSGCVYRRVMREPLSRRFAMSFWCCRENSPSTEAGMCCSCHGIITTARSSWRRRARLKPCGSRNQEREKNSVL